MGAVDHIMGWHEAVALPELGIVSVFAKLDTGSDRSVLHGRDVIRLKSYELEFALPLLLVQRSCAPFFAGGPRRVRARLVDERVVRSSNGAEEIRYVIETKLLISDLVFNTQFSITDRTGMQFPLLLGRSALSGRFLVDSSSSHLSPQSGQCQNEAAHD